MKATTFVSMLLMTMATTTNATFLCFKDKGCSVECEESGQSCDNGGGCFPAAQDFQNLVCAIVPINEPPYCDQDIDCQEGYVRASFFESFSYVFLLHTFFFFSFCWVYSEACVFYQQTFYCFPKAC